VVGRFKHPDEFHEDKIRRDKLHFAVGRFIQKPFDTVGLFRIIIGEVADEEVGIYKTGIHSLSSWFLTATDALARARSCAKESGPFVFTAPLKDFSVPTGWINTLFPS
jgi:hypothetical protein